jgi:hypothetical protein
LKFRKGRSGLELFEKDDRGFTFSKCNLLLCKSEII